MSAATIRLWDPLIRLFHLSLAGVFVANYFFNEPGDDWHTWLGYYVCAWLVLRLVWGFSGPRSARWADFWPTRARLAEHLCSLRHGRPFHRLGHSPLGALVMLQMMLAVAALGLTGFLMQEVDALWGVDWPMTLHSWIANGLLALVCLHVAAALYESLRLRENLPLSMITGRRLLPDMHGDEPPMLLCSPLPRKPVTSRAWLNLVLLASLSCVLLLADDFLQQLFTSNNRAELELGYGATLWLFSAALWLCNRRALVVAIVLLFVLMQLLQLGNISFFGEPLSAVDIQSLLNDSAEVRQTAMHSAAQHWPVLLCVAVPYGLLLALHLLVPTRVALPQSRWALVLIAVVLLSKPYRATYRNLDSFVASPSRSALHNSLNVFSAWAVRLAFREEVSLPPSPFAPYTLSAIPSSARHVWLVVADSLRSDRLGLFGYSRDTTPQLAAYLRDHPDAFARRGIAAGVATDVSLPYLLNPIREPGQDNLLRSGQINLFRFAREAGFRTHWLSSQESKLLAHLGSRYLDVSITREDHPLRFLQRQDRALLDILGQQRWADRNFVVLNLRTAHLPYAQNYRQESTPPPWPDQGPEGQSNAYDNSIHYLDAMLTQILADFDRLEGERYLIITGDHGQRLGEGGYWGHNDLVPEVSDVPVIVVAREAPSGALADFSRERWISHYEAGKWLAARLGTKIDNPNLRPNEYFVHGKLLFTDNFIQRVCESPSGLLHQPPQQLSVLLINPDTQCPPPS